ncbi:MAG: UbiD family decarboxylase, partial [Thaumarchaeota archaeon]|nr:UbiD family decarboxylase [Nitrososphaerota archaeon]
MPVKDLREFIEKIESMGELKKIGGADWDLEVGALTEMVAAKQETTALLFHDIKGYENGPRILTNCFNSMSRTAIALDLQVGLTGLDLLKAWRARLRTMKPVPPLEVNSGPIYENTITGADVDILKFPSPKWHKLDGGRYLGTACVVIMRDPEEDWINLGTYRVQVHDRDTTGIYMGPGKHGQLIAQKYWAKGKNCPIAVSLGHEPALYIP